MLVGWGIEICKTIKPNLSQISKKLVRMNMSVPLSSVVREKFSLLVITLRQKLLTHSIIDNTFFISIDNNLHILHDHVK